MDHIIIIKKLNVILPDLEQVLNNYFKFKLILNYGGGERNNIQVSVNK